jgi:hypothetical protein
MVEFSGEWSLAQVRQTIIAGIGSIVQHNELVGDFGVTGQGLALCHRAHPEAVEYLVRAYGAIYPETVSGNLSAFVGYWVRKARRDIDSYLAEHPYSNV